LQGERGCINMGKREDPVILRVAPKVARYKSSLRGRIRKGEHGLPDSTTEGRYLSTLWQAGVWGGELEGRLGLEKGGREIRGRGSARWELRRYEGGQREKKCRLGGTGEK